MSKIERGPEHQCGGPAEACCIPGCPECHAKLRHDDDRLVAHRVHNWDALYDRAEKAEAEVERLRVESKLYGLMYDHTDGHIYESGREEIAALQAELAKLKADGSSEKG